VTMWSRTGKAGTAPAARRRPHTLPGETRHDDVPPSRVVHLELHTGDLAGASAFYSRLLHWRAEQIDTASGSYYALDLGAAVGGGMVECGARRALWLPYVEVPRIDSATDLARRLGANVLLAPREGPAGWRSVVATPASGELALWQQKKWRA
jgi:predicted enzyme related to lactoylglutathione lyase